MIGYVLVMILPVVLAGPPPSPVTPPDDTGLTGPPYDPYQRIRNLERRVIELESTSSLVIGFSAYASTVREYSDTDVVVFDRVITNLGNGYSTTTNRFTCPVNGLYLFSVSIFQAHYISNAIACAIVLEGKGEVGEVTVKAFGAEGITDSSATTTVVECLAGQRVWIEVDDHIGGVVWGGADEPDSKFSGALIKPL